MDAAPELALYKDSEDDETSILVKVGAASNPGSIASVIAHGIYAGKAVRVRAIGASAVNQAIKSCVVASGYVAMRGFHLYVIPGFEDLVDENIDRIISAVSLSVVCKRR